MYFSKYRWNELSNQDEILDDYHHVNLCPARLQHEYTRLCHSDKKSKHHGTSPGNGDQPEYY